MSCLPPASSTCNRSADPTRPRKWRPSRRVADRVGDPSIRTWLLRPTREVKWLYAMRESVDTSPAAEHVSQPFDGTQGSYAGFWGRQGPPHGRRGDRWNRMPAPRQRDRARPALGVSAIPSGRDHRGAAGPVEPGPLLRPGPGHAGPDVHAQRRFPAELAVGLRPGVLRHLAA